MKNNFIISLFTCVIFVGCNYIDNIESPNNDVKLHATHENITRVTFDGKQSAWSDDDKLNVIVDGLNNIYEFSYDPNSAYFICKNLTLPAEKNNIYAFYGVKTEKINFENHSAHVQLAAPKQTQDSKSPVAHIATYDILYGNALNADKSKINIAMNHSVAVIKINIENALPESKNIKSIVVSAPDGTVITGLYKINAANNSVVIDPSVESFNVITTTISDSIVLATGATYNVWTATAPFSIGVGEKLIIDITTDNGEVYRCEKKAMEVDLTFSAGHIMSTKVTLGEDALLVATQDAEKISVEFDFDAGGILPVDFPNSPDDGINKGTYKICGYDFLFNSPVAFYSNEDTSYRIRFESGITNSNHATIKLPTKDGYKISAITLSSIDSNKNKYRDYRFSITDEGGATFNGGEFEILSKEKYTYNLDGTANKDCYIRISHLNSNKNTIDLGYIAITYTKI